MSELSRDRWAEEHGEFPLLMLGWRTDRGNYLCLDHPRSKRSRERLWAGDEGGEAAQCSVCGKSLRRADAFGLLDESEVTA